MRVPIGRFRGTWDEWRHVLGDRVLVDVVDRLQPTVIAERDVLCNLTKFVA